MVRMICTKLLCDKVTLPEINGNLPDPTEPHSEVKKKVNKGMER